MGALLACPRKHYYRYEAGLAPEEAGHALRFGSAFHAAMEARWRGAGYEAALKSALDGADRFGEIDAAVLAGLLSGYFACWGGTAELVSQVEPEMVFSYPLKGSLTFRAAGRIDGIGRLADGRLCLVEHKTCGEDISDGAEYWMRLRFNPQVYQYVSAARALGHNVESVVYDVTRKPSIRQRQGEAVEEYAQRLADDTLARPGFYFARREAAVTDADIESFEAQRLGIGQAILCYRRMARQKERPERAWPMNCNAMACRGCEFSGFCLSGVAVDAERPPSGFKSGVFNPELS